MPGEVFLGVFFLVCVISYLIGSIPFGYLYAKYMVGVDVRDLGSHSTGATNVLRAGGKKLALLTLLSDAFKGSLVTGLGLFFSTEICLISSAVCILGHVFPIWLKFKGGKGAATAGGTFLVLAPIIALISAVIWGGVAKFTKKSSIASLSFCFTFILIAIIGFITGYVSFPIIIYSIVVFIFLLFTHRENIKRILKKEELKI